MTKIYKQARKQGCNADTRQSMQGEIDNNIIMIDKFNTSISAKTSEVYKHSVMM